MADPVITELTDGESTLAATVVNFLAQPAGTWLLLVAVTDAYKAGNPAGWAAAVPEVQANHGLSVWSHLSTGVETSVTYTLSVAARSVYTLIAITNLDETTPFQDGSGTFSNAVGDTIATPAEGSAAQRELGLGIVGASHSGGFFTGVGSWTNGYVEVAERFNPATAPGLCVGIAALAFNGGAPTNTAATFTGPSAQSRTAVQLVYNVSAVATGEADFDGELIFTATAEQIFDGNAYLDMDLAFVVQGAAAAAEGDGVAEFEGELVFTATGAAEDENTQEGNAYLDMELAFSAIGEGITPAEGDGEADFTGQLVFAVAGEAVPTSDSGSPWRFDCPIAASETCCWPVVAPDCCDSWDNATTEQREKAMRLAVDFLWAASGRQFGTCEVTVRPCGLSCPCTSGPCHLTPAGLGTLPWQPHITSSGAWSNSTCSECRCCAPCEVALPGPVSSITRVVVYGSTIDASAYRVDNARYLVRDDGQCWPECNDYSKRTGAGVFEVTYVTGNEVPYGGMVAAGALACSLIQLCPDGQNCGDCLSDAAATAVVDQWLALVNPNKLSQPATLIIPGDRSTSVRTQTWP